MKANLAISIIIPTLNEAANIKSLLKYLHTLDSSLEIVVADGSSTDNTRQMARQLARVIEAPRGRGAQMNAGAHAATGDVLWFIHADCKPHTDSVQAMRTALIKPDIVGGAFEYNLDHPHSYFRTVEWWSNHKNQRLRTFYGDMGIFTRADVFEQINGYAEIPLMEDMDFCRRLKNEGEIIILPQRIMTSARRWIDEGIVKNLVRNWLLQLAWMMGASPETLAKWYQFK